MGKEITRREFAAGMAAAGILAAGRSSARGSLAANERVRLAIIGVGNRGDQLIDAFKVHKDAEIAAICDLYEPYLEFARRKVGGQPFITKDYREVLARKDVDAVLIATPDHWHALQFIDACAADKDVYVEKPLSLTIAEGRKMVEAAARHHRITQMGVQRRSSPVYQKAVEIIRSGALGKITACRCFFIRNESPLGIGDPRDGSPPPGLDWNRWLGPAPEVPFNENRCLYKFRWFRNYSGGQMTNFGTHYVDVIQWALGELAPVGVFATGSRSGVRDNRELPVTMQAIWEYPDDTLVTFSQFGANSAPGSPRGAAIELRGTKGTVFFNGESLDIVPEVLSTQPLPALNPLDREGPTHPTTQPGIEPYRRSGRDTTAEHARNFLDCVKTRKPCNCPVEIGHRSTTSTLLANIAMERHRYLTWNSQSEKVTNDPDANKLLSYEYRSPWKLPG